MDKITQKMTAPAIEAMRDETSDEKIIIDLCAAHDTAKGKDKKAALSWVAGCLVKKGGRMRLEPVSHALRAVIAKSAKSAYYWRPLTAINEADKEAAAAMLAEALEEYDSAGLVLGKTAAALRSAGEAKLQKRAAEKEANKTKRKEAKEKAQKEADEISADLNARDARIKARDADEKKLARLAEMLSNLRAAISAAIMAGAEKTEIDEEVRTVCRGLREKYENAKFTDPMELIRQAEKETAEDDAEDDAE